MKKGQKAKDFQLYLMRWKLNVSFLPITSMLDKNTSIFKRVLNFVKQVFFLLSTEGSLVDTRAYLALY